MTHFGDNLYLGGARLTPADGGLGGFGVGPLGRVYEWDITPVVSQTNNIVAAAAIGAGLAAVLAAGTGATLVVNGRGETVVQADVPRNVQVTASGNEAARTVLVTGYDRYGQKMSELISGLNVNTVQGLKAFFQILSVTESAASVGNISVGFSTALGVPVRVINAVYINSVKWDSTLAANAGTFVAADVTDPATTTTGDVRGTYIQAGNAADGVRRLVMAIAVPAIGSGPDATRIGAYGVTQNLGLT